jgi:hypothetical protein
MENDDLLTRIRTRQAADLRACFPGLSERDLMQILTAPRYAVNILQGSFGGNAEEAKAAWNDFVLRHLDGPHNIDRLDKGSEQQFFSLPKL